MFNLDDYETVEERLAKFWKEHADGQIHTRLLEHTSGRFIVEASIYRTEADARPWTTGLAEETVQGRGVNATSALENCETSAIGRALAAFGLGGTEFASADEVARAITGKSGVPVDENVEDWLATLEEATSMEELEASYHKAVAACPNSKAKIIAATNKRKAAIK